MVPEQLRYTPTHEWCRMDGQILVIGVTDHGEHVYTVELRPLAPVPRFKPGQFLHLALDRYEPGGFWPESRVFSIASSPTDRDRLSITFAVKGAFTTRMERELTEGVAVWAKLPYGEFVVDPARDAVLFAGGTGVTAFTAFLQSLTPERAPRVLLFYGARKPNLFVYRSLVETCARDVPSLTCTRSNALGAGSAYPGITLTVNVSPTVPASVTNTATVSGGGEVNTGNDTAAAADGIFPNRSNSTGQLIKHRAHATHVPASAS